MWRPLGPVALGCLLCVAQLGVGPIFELGGLALADAPSLAAAQPGRRDDVREAVNKERGGPIPVVLGRMGSKARGATPNLPQRLREAISRDLRQSAEVQVLDERDGQTGGRFTIESSVTEMSRRVTPSGELEVTCEVSMVIGLLPSRAIVGMTSGGATIQGPRRGGRPSKALALTLEADALSYAVRGANQNLLVFLRNHQR